MWVHLYESQVQRKVRIVATRGAGFEGSSGEALWGDRNAAQQGLDGGHMYTHMLQREDLNIYDLSTLHISLHVL